MLTEKTKIGKPPCGSCSLCCHETVVLHEEEGDKLESYKTRIIPSPETGELVTALMQKPNSNACVYLSKDDGCTIYENRPSACRLFDCRLAWWQTTVIKMSRKEKQSLPKQVRNVITKGGRLYCTLDATFNELMSHKSHAVFKRIEVK